MQKMMKPEKNKAGEELVPLRLQRDGLADGVLDIGVRAAGTQRPQFHLVFLPRHM
jgi:hypothetical protein